MRIWNGASNNTVEGVTVKNRNLGMALWLDSSGTAIQCSLITGNGSGVHIGGESTGNSVNFSHIEGNSGYGLNAANSIPAVNAEHNYWGSVNGPRPVGSGDLISSNVDADPFHTSAEELGCGIEALVPPPPDDDADGVFNDADLCPGTTAEEPVDANGCGASQLDDDGDGAFNDADMCANTPAGEAVDANGCSASQLDDNGDGVFNNADLCPGTPIGELVDANGCGASQLDDDGDGVLNDADLCPGTSIGEPVDADGCSTSQRVMSDIPDCGATITANLILTADLDCTGHTGTALTVGADGVTIDGQGHSILAPDAWRGIDSQHNGVGIVNLTVSGGSSSGIFLSGSGNTIAGVDVSWNSPEPKGLGLHLSYASDSVIDNVIANNRLIGIRVEGNGVDPTNINVTNVSTNASKTGLEMVTASGNRIADSNFSWDGADQVGVGVELRSSSSNNTVENVTVTNRYTGISVTYASSSNNVIQGNNVSGNYHGVLVLFGSPSDNIIQNNDLSNNEWGIIAGAMTGYGNKYLNNNLSNTTGWAMTVHVDNQIEISGNVFTGSANGIQVQTVDGLSLSGQDLRSISGTSLFVNATNSTFTNIKAGGEEWGISVFGSGNTFSDLDLSWDGSTPSGVGLYVHDSTGTVIDNVTANNRTVGVKIYGTSEGMSSNNRITNVSTNAAGAGVVLSNANGNYVADSDMSWDGPGHVGEGVRFSLSSSNNTVEGVTVNNRSAGISLGYTASENAIRCSQIVQNQSGITSRTTGAGNSVNFSHIEGNSDFGVLVDWGSVLVNAEHNYWGSADGPGPEGSGDLISSYVDADPFHTSAEELGCGIEAVPASGVPVNNPPLADAGPDQKAEWAGEALTLDGSRSSDPDGDELSFGWTQVSGPAATIENAAMSVASFTPSVVGAYVFRLGVTDTGGATSSDDVVITVVSAAVLAIEGVYASPDVLDPPNHQMVPVTVTVNVVDGSETATCYITSVTSNEPVNGGGDGDADPDWEITGDLSLNLRAERSGLGDDRIYTITVACEDASGNIVEGSTSVKVLHDSQSSQSSESSGEATKGKRPKGK